MGAGSSKAYQPTVFTVQVGLVSALPVCSNGHEVVLDQELVTTQGNCILDSWGQSQPR